MAFIIIFCVYTPARIQRLSLDVSGSVNATAILTNSVALGSIVYGTWLNPTYVGYSSVNCYYLSVSSGTWLFTGSVYFTSSSNNGVYVAIGPTSAMINQNNSRRYTPALNGNNYNLSSTFIGNYTTATTIYFVCFGDGTGTVGNNNCEFQAVKIG